MPKPMHNKCNHCHKPIVLQPSAQARADAYGGVAEDYKKLFTMHAECVVAYRNTMHPPTQRTEKHYA